jgi:hypothetical protein
MWNTRKLLIPRWSGTLKFSLSTRYRRDVDQRVEIINKADVMAQILKIQGGIKNREAIPPKKFMIDSAMSASMKG